MSISLFLLTSSIIAQPPTVAWDNFFPGAGDYEYGTYTIETIKQSPYGGYVIVGSRKIQATNGYHEVMVIRVDEDGASIRMNETFTGVTIDNIYVDGEWVLDTIPWTQEAYDMVFTHAEDSRYLITGYRDITLVSADSPPGLFLMEIAGDGRVYFDSLYYNDNDHWIMGRCIQPDLEGGYVIVGSIMVDGESPERAMMIRVKKNEEGEYDVVSDPYMQVIEVGDNGYATWVRPFGEGYLLGGNAYTGTSNKHDLFIQKVDADGYEEWETFYGMSDNDEFADGLLAGDTIYLTGSVKVPESGRSQFYVVKAESDGTIIWENTYGGSSTYYAQKIVRTSDGNLLVAGNASVGGYSQMVLLKIDAATGDSLWMQPYKTNFKNAGIRDAIRTDDFNYLAAGRASYTSSQDPHVYVMKLDNPLTEDLFLEREGLNLDIVTTTPTEDVIDVSTDKINLFGLVVMIDSLLHPSVGDLEISLEHGGTTVTLVDQPSNSGKNFIRTALADASEWSLNVGSAPYTGWYTPAEPLFPFLFHDPSGQWTLTITDHGTGVKKATDRVLEGWSLNLLTEAGAGVGIPTVESLANFGLESIHPNPLNQEARISFRIPEPGHVKLLVYNQLGQQVARLADEKLPAGIHQKTWNPGNMAPGTYFIQLESGGMMSVRKAMITK